MQLTHTFTVPAGIEQTWEALGDIESVAGCFPGAQVTSADETSFEGTVKVKLGPIALVYKGSGEFVDKDASAHRMAIKALGKDKRGNGTAGADVVATMTELGASSTQVEVVTDLNVTGKPAQFGRGVMQDVSDKLLGQFVDCLAGRLAAPAEAEAQPPAVATPEVAQETETSTSAPAAAPTAPPAVTAPATTRSAPSSSGSADAIDLGATALPVLLKAYGPQIAAGVGALALLLCLLRRRRD
ncbi:SRPBCC family protein [Janibacter limosus]|uniref:SRPBCC family protein n=1 Tax=Janibacter limosus TaxID=53458 RepID=UPI000831624B|nr:SRPBCC family protein [Janibacter limosus]